MEKEDLVRDNEAESDMVERLMNSITTELLPMFNQVERRKQELFKNEQEFRKKFGKQSERIAMPEMDGADYMLTGAVTEFFKDSQQFHDKELGRTFSRTTFFLVVSFRLIEFRSGHIVLSEDIEVSLDSGKLRRMRKPESMAERYMVAEAAEEIGQRIGFWIREQENHGQDPCAEMEH